MQADDHPNRHLSALFDAEAHMREREAAWLQRLHPHEEGD
jgi:hypothetical protein